MPSLHREDYEAWIAAHPLAVTAVISFALGVIIGVFL
jgi:hypothetical protein